MPTNPAIGLVGFGTFGRFIHGHLSSSFDVSVFDVQPRSDEPSVAFEPLEAVLQLPLIIIAIPVGAHEALWKEHGSHVNPAALVIDVSSVKLKPIALMEQYLPSTCQLVATHPLFGPQSGKNGIAGLPIVVWPVRVDPARFECIKDFLARDLKLRIIEKSPDEHDRQMAYVQALTFFIGRALERMKIPRSELTTATYQHLLDITQIVGNDSLELFHTIQRENPMAPGIRREFVEHLTALQIELAKVDEK